MDLLAARELELGSSQSLNHMFLVLQLGSDGHDDLANVNPGHCALGLPKGTTHPCLEPVSPSTGQHLDNTNNMEKMEPHLDMKVILATTILYGLFVGTNTGSLQCFRRELLIFI